MEFKDEKINEILNRAKDYRQDLRATVDSFSEKEMGEAFKEILDEYGNITRKDENINDKNNIILKCKITEKEALNGCMKKIKYKQLNSEGKQELNTINLKIPQNIKDGQKIILYNDGNYIKEKDSMSKVIVEIKVK